MQIRLAAPPDADTLADLSGELGYPTTAGDVARRLAALAGDPAHAVLVADVGPTIAGFAHVAAPRDLISADCAEIQALVVRAGGRGRGVGRALVAAAEAWAAARGCTEIRVRSNVVRERAHAFYRARGYEVIKTQTVFGKRLAAGR